MGRVQEFRPERHGLHGRPRLRPRARRPRQAPAAAGEHKVALLINGEPVYEDDLAAGLPADAFQETLDEARLSRLDRLYRDIPLLAVP